MAKFWLLFWLLLLLLSLPGAISKQEEEEDVKLRLLAVRPPLRLSFLLPTSVSMVLSAPAAVGSPITGCDIWRFRSSLDRGGFIDVAPLLLLFPSRTSVMQGLMVVA